LSFATIPEQLNALRRDNNYRRRRTLESPQGREVVVDGRRLLNFCSNDYLGLAADERVTAAFKQGVERWGVGSGASHMVCGHSTAHRALEEAVAEWTGRERALLFSSGYAANTGTLNALLGPGDHVYQDRLNHASLLDGGWLSRAEFHWYRHNDPRDLGQCLAEHVEANPEARHLVVSDGTFSMDGDTCRLDDLVEVARRYNAGLFIDDAHGLGVQGTAGCGVVDPDLHASADVSLLMATFGKALGTAGAFVAGDGELIDYVIQRARPYIFTTALPPALAEATLCSLAIARDEDWRRERLRAHVQQFRAGAHARNIALSASQTPIQPIVIGSNAAALAVSEALERDGILVSAIRPPSVPVGSARLRVTFSAAHETADIARLLTALEQALSQHADAALRGNTPVS